MITTVDEEAERFVQFFPTLGRIVREASVGHPLYGALDQLLEAFGNGYLTYLSTGSTPESAYLSMRWLSCMTDGRFNTVMQELIRSSYEPYSPVHRRGLFGDMNGAAIEEVRTGLINDGFWVFKERLGTDQIERLRAFGSTVDCLA